ncbi:putative Adenylate cyclase [Desulfamplus magnetovallimortis]|uniref:Putative Adenylate cyclase n=1 Tax=Desulfamplus magnetovallimortis TaxID=1246637 RepID=A0A1W1H9S1_9BACT|nr:adenylate/guanylate cyclase domain-containing protein [Desulfamplus magnetovallimortis]SLM29118.1 putative Adenylate cyclase [Desulfamplus magnetovallimortis]
MNQTTTPENSLQQPTSNEHDSMYRELVESLNVGIFRITPYSMTILHANPAIANIFGHESMEDFMQTSMKDYYQHPRQQKEIIEHIRVYGQCKNKEIAMRKKDGTPIWVSLNAIAKYEQPEKNNGNTVTYNNPEFLRKNGIIKWVDCVIEDITERKESLNRLKKLNKAYERFVPYEFLKTLGKTSIEDVELNDRIQKKMTVLFSDIRLFSTLSERMTPEENFKFINSYLSHMGPLVREHNGFIDKFIGDSIMALFGINADDAVSAAIGMLNKLKKYNEGRKRAGYRTIEIGIGINTGTLILGTVGEADRMEGTVISDAVNTAARLEKLTKTYKTPLLISEYTFHSLQKSSDFAIRFIDRVLVKGRNEPISIYEIFNADEPDIFEAKRSYNHLFETAMYHFHYQDMEQARTLLRALSEQCPEDAVIERYLTSPSNRSNIFFSPWQNRKHLELKRTLFCDIPVIDEDHVEMFYLTDQLMETIKKSQTNEKIILGLIELNRKAAQHFQTEEKMMLQAGYPEYEQHLKLHKEFLVHSESILELASITNYSLKSEALHLLLRIESLFVEWLANHEIMRDRDFIGFMMGFK